MKITYNLQVLPQRKNSRKDSEETTALKAFLADSEKKNMVFEYDTPQEAKKRYDSKDLGGGKFIAHYTSTAQADYKGFLFGGRAVNFEAKYTDVEKMTQDRVTADQTERLERAHQFGAVVFVLCSFGSVGFYRVPWTVWRDMKGRFGHKYITPQEAAPYEVRIGGPGVLLFLEGLEDTP